MILSFVNAIRDINARKYIRFQFFVLILRSKAHILKANNTICRTNKLSLNKIRLKLQTAHFEVKLTKCLESRRSVVNLHSSVSKAYLKNQTENSKKIRGINSKMSFSDSFAVTSSVFKGKKDRFNGITVDSEVEKCDDNFNSKLLASLEYWSKENVRAVWFKVALQDAEWIPVLAKNGFKFHRTQPTNVTLVKWLPATEICNIPQYAHTMIGVGAVVVNKNEELLVVRERFHSVPHWKLPGGYANPGEDIPNAAIREVLEETNVQTKFKYLICFRHAHGANFDCSDIYFIVCLIPVSEAITKCDHEIAACQWMKISDYLTNSGVHETNCFFVKKFLECEKTGNIVGCTRGVHPILKNPQCLYSVHST